MTTTPSINDLLTDLVNSFIATTPDEAESLSQQDKLVTNLIDRLRATDGDTRAKEIGEAAINETDRLHRGARTRTLTSYEQFAIRNYTLIGHLFEAVLYQEHKAGEDKRAENMVNALFGDEQVLTEVTREDALRVAKILAAR